MNRTSFSTEDHHGRRASSGTSTAVSLMTRWLTFKPFFDEWPIFFSDPDSPGSLLFEKHSYSHIFVS
jgi:hypothetical protein